MVFNMHRIYKYKQCPLCNKKMRVESTHCRGCNNTSLKERKIRKLYMKLKNPMYLYKVREKQSLTRKQRNIHPPSMKGSKNLIHTHHIDLNRKNNKESNKLYLNNSKHQLLHLSAYTYLVKKGLINKYIKWFIIKYNPKTYTLKQRLNQSTSKQKSGV